MDARDELGMPDLHTKAWGMTEAGLNGLLERIQQLDGQALLTRSGEKPRNASLTTMRGGVAVIEVIGPIFHYRNIITEILGFPSAEALAKDIRAAVDNPQAQSILLRIDSPGGQVGGINELAGIISSAKQSKTVQAYIADSGASAAYWLASAASRVAVDATAEVGSIGVVFGLRRRRDDSLEIVNSESPQKRPDTSTEEGIELIRQRANDLAEVFIQAVAKNRGISRSQVVSLRGGLLVGEAAIRFGLADEVGSLEGVIQALQNGTSGGRTVAAARAGTADTAQPVASATPQAGTRGQTPSHRSVVPPMPGRNMAGQAAKNRNSEVDMQNEDPLIENAKQRAGTGQERSEYSDSAVVQDARARTGAEVEDEENPLLENAKQRREARNG